MRGFGNAVIMATLALGAGEIAVRGGTAVNIIKNPQGFGAIALRVVVGAGAVMAVGKFNLKIPAAAAG